MSSVKQFKDGQIEPFANLMAQTMKSQSQGDTVQLRKIESLPNVNFASEQILGTAIELPKSYIPTEKPCNVCIKLETSSGSLGLLHPEGDSPEAKSVKNLKSWKMTKPDESGIKKVVQFAHEKLDPVHVSNRVFSDLPFHFLVAGELELILQDHIKPVERAARLHFLCMLCYHKQYLDISELRDQYDATLKNIERGTAGWAEFKDLERQLHTNLTFRATVKARQPDIPKATPGGTEVKKFSTKEGSGSEPAKVIYCSDYNKKACPFEDHHKGVFNKKQVTKWHICSKCFNLKGNPKRSHPASECKQA